MSQLASVDLRLLLEAAHDGFFVHDAKGQILDVNEHTCSQLGYSRDALLALNINDICCGSSAEVNLRNWAACPVGTQASIRETGLRSDGTTFPMTMRVTCQLVDGVKIFAGLARNVSNAPDHAIEMYRANSDLEALIAQRTKEIRDIRDRLHIAANVGRLGIWDFDMARHRLQCDAQWHNIMGLDPAQPVTDLAQFAQSIHPNDAERAMEVEKTAAQLRDSGGDYGIEFRIIRPDGTIRMVRSAASIQYDASGQPIRAIGFVIDITDAWRNEQALKTVNASLEHDVLTDPLTGVANRRALNAALGRACRHIEQPGQALTLAMIDIDCFKAYNDQLGHVQADATLLKVTKVLSATARRPADLVARYGGDEFILLLWGTDRALAILERIQRDIHALAIAHPASDVAPYVTISCGAVAVTGPHSLTPERLIELSDRALYEAKHRGRNTIMLTHYGAQD